MINIVTWLKDNKYREKLSMACARNNIRIVADEFENLSAFLSAFDEIDINIDVLVVSHEMLAETDIKEFLEKVKENEPNLRVVIVFPGYRNQYIEQQIKEYTEFGISDIIYEGQHLDEECFVEVVRKGYIYDYDVNVYDEPEEKPVVKEEPKKCVTVGVMGITHGTGVTNMVVNIANYISLSEECSVKAVDYSGTGNLRFAKGRKVTYIVHADVDISKLKKSSRAIVYDFGTPYNISAKGKLLNGSLSDELLKLFQECDLKILMSFSDIWHLGKIKFFLNNRQWRKKLDKSYLFLFDTIDDRFKTKHSKLNIYNRNDREIQKRISHLLVD